MCKMLSPFEFCEYGRSVRQVVFRSLLNDRTAEGFRLNESIKTCLSDYASTAYDDPVHEAIIYVCNM